MNSKINNSDSNSINNSDFPLPLPPLHPLLSSSNVIIRSARIEFYLMDECMYSRSEIVKKKNQDLRAVLHAS